MNGLFDEKGVKTMKKSKRPRIIIFTSENVGKKSSLIRALAEFTLTEPPLFNAEIVAIISTVHNTLPITHLMGINYVNLSKKETSKIDVKCVKEYNPDYIILFHWKDYIEGIEPNKIIYIHPGSFPEKGSINGGYGVYKNIMEAEAKLKNHQSAMTIHYVDEKADYGVGPIIARMPIYIRSDDTWKTLMMRTNLLSARWVARVLDLLVKGYINLEENKVVARNWIHEFCIKSKGLEYRDEF